MSDKENSKMPTDIKKMSFEDALEELEDTVRMLEDGSGALDDAIKSYERGAWLKKHCEAKLTEARARVDKVVVSSDNKVSAEPAELD